MLVRRYTKEKRRGPLVLLASQQSLKYTQASEDAFDLSFPRALRQMNDTERVGGGHTVGALSAALSLLLAKQKH